MKKLLAVSLAAVMTLSLFSGCSSSGDKGSSSSDNPSSSNSSSNTSGSSTTVSNTDKNSAVINSEHEYTSVICSLSSDAKTLCPYASDGGGREYTRAQCFEPLTFTNSQGDWEMVLAKEVTNPEPCVYDVEIYDYIHDQAGNPVTASDIVFSYDKFIEEGSNVAKVANLEKYEAISDYVVRFTFKEDLKGNAQELFDKCVIVTEKAWNDSPDGMVTTPVGTSPYALTSFESGSYYVYEYTGDYWQTDDLVSTRSMHNVDKITFRVYTDKSTDAIALQRGETDASGGLNYADYVNFCDPDTFEPKDGWNVDVITNTALYNLVFNCGENSVCSDINLRKAICTAIDVESSSYLGFGQGQYQCAAGYTNPVWLDYSEKVDDGEYYNYDVDQAKAYLEQSNYKGETIKMLVCQNTSARTMATTIQAYCSAIGINIELLEYDAAVYNETKRDSSGTSYDIDFNNERSLYYAWGGLGYWSNTYYDNGLCHAYVNDPTLQNLYDTMSKTTSTEDDVVAFCNYIEEQCYGYALTTYYQPCFTNDRFTNIVRFPQGNFILGACTVTPD
jgi:ABC-type transport system substrate-binding protein